MADLAQLREALGIEPDVDDDATIAYVQDLARYAEDNATGTDDSGGAQGSSTVPPATTPTPQPVVDVDALVESRVAASMGVYKDTISEQSAEIAALKKAWADRETAEAFQVRERVLASAVADGKITVDEAKPEGKWGKRYDTAPDVTASILADMAPGTAMPVMASGHSGTSDAIGTDEAALEADFDRMLNGGA